PSSSPSSSPSPSSIPPDLARALSIDLAALEETCPTTRLRRSTTHHHSSTGSIQSAASPSSSTSALPSSSLSSLSPFLAGDVFSVADCAVWPLVDALRRSGWDGWSDERWPELVGYWRALGEERGLLVDGGVEGEDASR
ncbi:hypothetical protein DBV05_g12570, partial [Lasiodiplodia theobromae]